VCGYIFTFVYTKFTDVCTPSLHVCVRIITYTYAKSTCDDDCFYYHSWRNNAAIAFGTLSSLKFVHIFTYIYTCVSMYAYMSVSVNVCMGIYMYEYVYVKGHCRCIQMQCVHMQIYVYISGFVHVCVCVYIYINMNEKTPCVNVECVLTNTGIHVCACILFTGVFHMCV